MIVIIGITISLYKYQCVLVVLTLSYIGHLNVSINDNGLSITTVIAIIIVIIAEEPEVLESAS